MSAILVYGPSGSGKSTAIQNLPPEKTFVICSDSKPLPFKGWKTKYKTVLKEDGEVDKRATNYLESKDPKEILGYLRGIEKNRDDIEYVVWDTFTHMLMHMYMEKAEESGWDKYVEFARKSYDLLNYIQTMTKKVVVIGHDEVGYDAKGAKFTKMRTIGKLLDEKIDIPSLFTVVLVPHVVRDGENSEYYFMTQSDGTNAAKSPQGMFSYKIPNDYKLIFDAMDKYES